MTTRIRFIALLCILLSLATGAAFGAGAFTLNLPVVLSAALPSQCSDIQPLLDQDTGLLSAGLNRNGEYILAYQDRAHGSQAHIVRHEGDHLVEVASPLPGAVFGVAPAFSPPGPKQGALALVMGGPGQRNRLYYTQRKPDDTPTEGPYGIWCLEF